MTVLTPDSLAAYLKAQDDRIERLERQLRFPALYAGAAEQLFYSEVEQDEMGFYDPVTGEIGPETTVYVPLSGRIAVFASCRVRPPDMETATTGEVKVSLEMSGANGLDWLLAGVLMSGFIDTGGQTTTSIMSCKLFEGLTPGSTTVKLTYVCSVDGFVCGVDRRTLLVVPL